jgi:hypothetical protein
MRIGFAFVLIIVVAGAEDLHAQTARRRSQRAGRSQPSARQQPRGAFDGFPDLAKVTTAVDPADVRAVTWRLAELMSFPYYPARGDMPLPPTERLYLPLRSM